MKTDSLCRLATATLVALIFTSLAAPNAHAAPISTTVLRYDLMKVGNPGNAADTTGYGSVGTVGGPDYWIGKNDVTIGQYRDFLTAVATLEDPRNLWNASMDSDQRFRGIQRTGSAGAWVYTVVGPNGTNPAGAQSAANRPITNVNWFDSARFANWMANGKPSVTGTGSAALAVIDNGAYNLGTATSGTAPAKNTTNPNTGAAPTFYIPTENEWYKAAYFNPAKGGPGTPGYYAYGTQSDTAPGNGGTSPATALANKDLANQANYRPSDRYAVVGTTTFISDTGNQNVLTDVGTFTNSASYYGAFDMSGNVYAWNDLAGTTGSSRGLRGGGWDDRGAFPLSSSNRLSFDPSSESYHIGFRLANPVPEPATLGMASGGALCACGWWVLKRRRRART